MASKDEDVGCGCLALILVLTIFLFVAGLLLRWLVAAWQYFIGAFV